MSVLSVSLLGGRTSANTALAAVGDLMDPTGYVSATETTSTTWGALACDALGEVGTPQVFRISLAETIQYAGRLLLRIPWTLTTQTATGTARASLNAKLFLNGVQVAAGQGGSRNINSSNGTQFTELIPLIVTTPVTVLLGTAIEIQIVPVILVVAAAAQTYVPTLRHDPQSVNDQLVVQGFGGAL